MAELETERTVLRSFEMSDVEVLDKWRLNPVYEKMAGFPKLKDTQDAIKLCQSYHDNPLIFAIELKQTQQVIGVFEINERGVEEETGLDKTKEVGFLLDEAYWNQGLMTEVLTKMLEFIFVELKQQEVWAACYIENLACQHLLEKTGFNYVYQLDYSQTPFLSDFFQSIENYYRLTKVDYEAF